MKIVIGKLVQDVESLSINEERSVDVDFDGQYLIQIGYDGQIWFVKNAMNGYGNNCLFEFKDEKVYVLD
jgi:hypothetical protein